MAAAVVAACKPIEICMWVSSTILIQSAGMHSDLHRGTEIRLTLQDLSVAMERPALTTQQQAMRPSACTPLTKPAPALLDLWIWAADAISTVRARHCCD